jgi:hypothetical protein
MNILSKNKGYLFSQYLYSQTKYRFPQSTSMQKESGQPKGVETKELLLRNMDLIMYVLYSGDEIFVMDMVKKVSAEVAEKYDNTELKLILKHKDKPMLYRCLFFLMLNFHKDFRSEIMLMWLLVCAEWVPQVLGAQRRGSRTKKDMPAQSNTLPSDPEKRNHPPIPHGREISAQ